MKDEGKEVRFYKYPNTSGRINIPGDLGKALKWKHKEILRASFETIDGKKGLFIHKEE